MGDHGIGIGLLGPLYVQAGGVPLSLPGRRGHVVLASLALSAGHVVTARALIDDVWSDELPQSATASLQSLITRLRRVVGATAIRTTAGGYVLDIDPDRVDVLRFRRLVSDAARCEEPEKARAVLEEALSLWRGDALAAIPSERLQRDVATGLAEERLAALERRIGLDLSLGCGDRLIGELRELVARHPARESLWHHLIVALDETGRRADAINTYHELRGELRRQFGVEPDGRLRELYQRLLVDRTPRETTGAAVAAAHPAVAADESNPALHLIAGRDDLPGDIADFTGRAAELDRLFAIASLGERPQTVQITAIDGMAGIGKTTLAVHLAHRLADRYPDGRLFIDLRGHTPGHQEPVDPAAALGDLLRAIGVHDDQLPESLEQRAGLWRSQLAGRRVLLVLDNAASAAQVRPLIPGTPGCLVIVTTRSRLTDLDGAQILSLDTLPAPDAHALFAAIVGSARCDAEPDAVRDVLGLCGNLPLAIRIAAAKLRARPAWSVRYLADRLADGRHRLAEFAAGERSVGAAFSLSYEHLEPKRRRMFRLLSHHPGTFVDVYVAAALADTDLRDADVLLEDLVDAHLLSQASPRRYQFHDLLRHYAWSMLERDESAEERDQALRRMLDYYASVLRLISSYHAITGNPSTAEPGDPAPGLPRFVDNRQTFAWCNEQRQNLVAIIEFTAREHHDEYLCEFLGAVWWYFRMRHQLTEWTEAQSRAVEAAQRLGDPHLEADMRKILALAFWQSERFSPAVEQFRRALDLYTADGRMQEAAYIRSRLGYAELRRGEYTEALGHLEGALLDSEGADGNPHRQAAILANLADGLRRTGRIEEALVHAQRSLALFEQVHDFLAEGELHSLLGTIHGLRGERDEALEHHAQALRIIRLCEVRAYEIEALNGLAETLLVLGETAQAVKRHEEALEYAEQLHHRYEQARAHRGLARAQPETVAATRHADQARALLTQLGLPTA